MILVLDMTYNSTLDECVMVLLIAAGSDCIGRNDSIVCALHEIDSIFAKSPTIAAATIACLDWICLNGLITPLPINSWQSICLYITFSRLIMDMKIIVSQTSDQPMSHHVMLRGCYLYTSKVFPYRYSWSWSVIAHFKQRNSNLWMGYFDSDLDNDWLA